MAGNADYASSWLSLFELFEAASGFRLRMDIADTLLIRNGRLLAWFYSARDGTVTRATKPELTEFNILQKLGGQNSYMYSHPTLNPHGFVALALYEQGTSRPVSQQELQAMLQRILSSGQEGPQQSADLPFCIQAFIPPARNMRYFACALVGQDRAPRCTTFARRFQARPLTPTSSIPNTAEWAAARAASAAAMAALAASTDDSVPLTAEDLLVESQLMALGLVEPMDQQDASEASLPVPSSVKADIQSLVNTLTSYIERAHGHIIQGLVAEFVQSPHQERCLVLVAVHAVQFDVHSTHSRLGAFTERWADLIGSLGPPSPTGSSGGRPSATRRNIPSAMLMRNSEGRPTSAPFHQLRPSPLNLPSPTLYTPPPTRPESAAAMAVASALQRGKAARMSAHFTPSPANGHLSARTIASASRKGAGGNAVPNTPSAASYTLWAPRHVHPSETLTGNLALELEVMREKLQRQADIGARAEAALNQLSSGCKGSQVQLLQQIQELQAEVAASRQDTQAAEQDFERLRTERQELQIELTALQLEKKEASNMVERERATLASSVRANCSTAETMEETIQQLKANNSQLSQQAATLQRRVEEGNEVLDATKAQLLEYRNTVSTLQQQLRRGKKLSAGPQSLAASISTPALQYMLSERPNSRDFQLLALDGAMQGSPTLFEDPSLAYAVLGAATPGARSRPPTAPASRLTAPGGATSGRAGSAGDALVRSRSGRIRDREGIVSFNGTFGRSGTLSAPYSPPHGPSALHPPQPSSSPLVPSQYGTGQFVDVTSSNSGLLPSSSNYNSIGTDVLSQQLQELRRQRKLLSEPSADGPGSAPAGGKSGSGNLEEAKAARLESARSREHWRPNYEAIVLSDLFIAGGEMMERMAPVHAALIKALRHVEDELLDIFCFYARIKRVRMRDDKLVMCMDQFCCLATEVGLRPNDPVVEDIYTTIADRTMGHGESGKVEPYIDFELFPEAVARLGAVKYDWRVPFSDEEADTEMEVPPALKEAMAELAAAAVAAVATATASEKGGPLLAQGSTGSVGRPWLPSPATSSKGARPGSGIKASVPPTALMAAAVMAAACPGGSPKLPPPAAVDEHSGQPLHSPEQILLVMIKTFIFHDLLARARRPKTAGSTVAKQKAQERTTPTDVWKV